MSQGFINRIPIPLPVSDGGTGSTTSTGTGSVVLQDSPALTTPDLGIPTALDLTNATSLPIATGVDGLGAGVADFLSTPSSANLATAVTGETGTGALVFATSPALVTPALGTPVSGDLTNCTIDNGIPVKTDVNGVTGADQVVNVMSLTTAEYGAITPVANVLYLITDA